MARTEKEEEGFRRNLDAEAKKAAAFVAVVSGDRDAIDQYFSDKCAQLAREQQRARNAFWTELTRQAWEAKQQGEKAS